MRGEEGNVDVGGGTGGICGDFVESGAPVEEEKVVGEGVEIAPGGERGLADGADGEGLWDESNWSRTSGMGNEKVEGISFTASYIL